ncbi:unnamed protein product [Notodromas monacha]|uniref:Uncharacterized protein n=1 Tax=Notodromas monacha TaxID=399045 RepID=A0A7R9GC10_9CRUS|nr:unnamed protein product [Notodromas monacha]CAG0915608.1 unnamed protein product [Notodromas monacha]
MNPVKFVFLCSFMFAFVSWVSGYSAVTRCYSCGQQGGTSCSVDNRGTETVCWVPMASCATAFDSENMETVNSKGCANTTGLRDYCLQGMFGYTCYCSSYLCNAEGRPEGYDKRHIEDDELRSLHGRILKNSGANVLILSYILAIFSIVKLVSILTGLFFF